MILHLTATSTKKIPQIITSIIDKTRQKEFYDLSRYLQCAVASNTENYKGVRIKKNIQKFRNFYISHTPVTQDHLPDITKLIAPIVKCAEFKRTYSCFYDYIDRVSKSIKIFDNKITYDQSIQMLSDDLIHICQTWEEVTWDDKAEELCVTTPKEIVLTDAKKESYNLGKFRLTFYFPGFFTDTYAMEVKALTPHWPKGRRSHDVPHPHVMEGELCLGRADGVIHRAMAEFRLLDALDIVHSVLWGYNGNSHDAYVRLEDWNMGRCEDCEAPAKSGCTHCESALCKNCERHCHLCDDNKALCASCAHECRHCGRDACNNHTTYCNQCGHYACNKCLTVCPTCKSTHCLDCVRTCPTCGKKGCSRCGNHYFDGAHLCKDCYQKSLKEKETNEQRKQKPKPTAKRISRSGDRMAQTGFLPSKQR